MDVDEWDHWFTRHKTLLPQLQHWFSAMGRDEQVEVMKAWHQAMSDLTLAEAMEATDAIVRGDIECKFPSETPKTCRLRALALRLTRRNEKSDSGAAYRFCGLCRVVCCVEGGCCDPHSHRIWGGLRDGCRGQNCFWRGDGVWFWIRNCGLGQVAHLSCADPPARPVRATLRHDARRQVVRAYPAGCSGRQPLQTVKWDVLDNRPPPTGACREDLLRRA